MLPDALALSLLFLPDPKGGKISVSFSMTVVIVSVLVTLKFFLHICYSTLSADRYCASGDVAKNHASVRKASGSNPQSEQR